jgi:hypothetical protein
MLQIIQEPTSVNKFMSGRSIVRAIPRMSAAKLAYGAADCCVGNTDLTKLTTIQAAKLWQVSTTYVRYALNHMEARERNLIEAGAQPLAPSRTKMLLQARDEDLIALAATIGADRWLAAAARAGI